MLVKETEMMKAAQESNVREFAQSDSIQRDLEKQLKQKEWELEDVKAMNNARLVVVSNDGRVTELVDMINNDRKVNFYE